MSEIEQITVSALFDAVHMRLSLAWITDPEHGQLAKIEPPEASFRRPTLVGYLNLIHSNKVQIIGTEELAYLDSLAPKIRLGTLQKIIEHRPAVLVFTRNQPVPEDLLSLCVAAEIPVWSSGRSGHELLTFLQYTLARALAKRVTLHGVFLEVYSIGVLITGEAGVGKSELALELMTRGHRLIADDAPDFTLIAPDVVDGTCPEILQDCLEVRGLGVLNVREMFGDTAVKRNKYLRLIVHLRPEKHDYIAEGTTRLFGDTGKRNVLDVEIPQLTIPVAPGRNLAVLVEAAVRNHILKSKGIDAAQIFIDRQAHQMRKEQLW
jgi:HPr kinase/phosphorylase